MSSRIVVLGTCDLRSPEGGQVQSVLQQPRRFALLAYLALATRKGPVGRDTVLGVFWADKAQDKARGALNQAVHYLRRSLGPEAIRTLGDTIELNRELVTCDAADFVDACDAERWREAAALYAGDLLPGFYDSAPSPDFEHWLEGERRALNGLLRDAAWRLARESEQAGASADAIVWARRACAASGDEESALRGLIELMDRLGDRTGVLEAYERLSSALGVLDLEPSPATTELVETLKRRWAGEGAAPSIEGKIDARKAEPAAVESVAGVGPSRPSGTGAPDAPSPGPPPRSRRRAVALAGLVLLAAAAIVLVRGLPRGDRAASALPESAATVRVERLDADEGGPLPSGTLSDNLVSNLQAMTSLDVIDGTGAAPERQSEAMYVLRGGVARADGRIYVNIRLLDGASGSTLASQRFERAEPEAMETIDALGRAIANFARRAIGLAREQRLIAESGAPPRAITLVQLGRADLELGDSLRKAGVLDAARSSYDKADSVLALAAELAPSWEQPWIERARIADGRIWLDLWARGGAEARRIAEAGIAHADQALARDDSRIETIEMLASLHMWVWLLSQPDPQGTYDAALAAAESEARHVTAVAPHRARPWNVLGAVLLQRGEWGDAYWALKRAIAADTYLENDLEIVSRLFTAAWETDNLDAARDWCALIRDRIGTQWPTAYCELSLEAAKASPDTSRIMRLRNELSAEPQWTSVERQFDALSAVVRAHAGDGAGARTLLGEPPAADNASDLPSLQAWAWLEVGDTSTARTLLDRYIGRSPTGRSGILSSRRFEGLR